MAGGFLTTHVLDTGKGCPAEGVQIELFSGAPDAPSAPIAVSVTNSDGRTDAPILPEDRFETGVYRLIFHVGDYLRRTQGAEGQLLFLDHVPIQFGMSENAHYHVPLLLSPYGYSTYRGS